MTSRRVIAMVGALSGAVLASGCGDTSEPLEISPVTVTGVAPAGGLLAGGTAVTITGTNFIAVTSVSVGGSELRNQAVVSETEITGNTPASSSAGPADVVVISRTHGNATCAGCFNYSEPPDPTPLRLP